MQFKLTVNGQLKTVDAPADMPLLWALRDLLNLNGTKYGCGIGQCGACTVHLNGAPVRACITTLEMAAKGRITTIEGLSPNGSHPVQAAWQEVDAPQCGYCQTGQIMAAAALLAKKPHPTDQEIDAAMDGNLCRCGTYLRIRQAIHKAAEKSSASAGKTTGAPAGKAGGHQVVKPTSRAKTSAQAKGGTR